MGLGLEGRLIGHHHLGHFGILRILGLGTLEQGHEGDERRLDREHW